MEDPKEQGKHEDAVGYMASLGGGKQFLAWHAHLTQG